MIEKHLKDVQGLVRVSSGEEPPHILIQGTEVLDVFTGSLFKADIWTYKAWIAYVGEKTPSPGRDTFVIDGNGLVAVPGYIDAHGHADLFYNPAAFGDFAVTRGATTVFSDGHDMMSSIGVSGFEEVMKVSDCFALKYLWGVPATYPPFPHIEGGELFSLHDIWRLFSDYKDCASISELSPYMRILRNEENILERILMARSLNKNVEGHTLGASYDKLNVLVAAGITSCHESIRESDLINRVRLGLSTMVRHSSIRSDLRVLAKAVAALPPDAIILVSDGVFAGDLLTKGYMDYVIKEAIGQGIEPAQAIRMATLNPARYFRLDGNIGSITPSRIADILLLSDLSEPTPLKVIERGRLVAEGGRLTIPPASFPNLGTAHHPYTFDSVTGNEMKIRAKGDSSVPVIDIVDQTVTRRVDLRLPERDGCLLPSAQDDVRKVLYTRRETKHWGRGFVRGIGARVGGISASIGHETHGLMVLGFDDEDMALAARTVLAMGGGVVIVDNGEVIHTLPLPIGATMSDHRIEDLAIELGNLKSLLQEKGSTLDDPLWTMGFLTFTSIVELRLTVSGVYDVKKGVIVF